MDGNPSSVEYIIPADILNYIHEIVYSDANCDTRRSVALSHVSRLWRDVVVDNPRLWSRIFISNSWSSDRLETYLTRSKKYPLRIKMVFNFTGFSWVDNDHLPDLKGIGHHLKLHQDHLQRIEIRGALGNIPFTTMLHDILHGLSDMQLPLLEGLSIDVHDMVTQHGPDGDTQYVAASPILPYARRLSTVELGGNSFIYLSPPFSEVTTLYLRSLDPRYDWGEWTPSIDILEVICACKHLQRLTIDNRNKICYYTSRRVTIPTLRFLRITGRQRRGILIHAPNLEELLVSPMPEGYLQTINRNFGCKITTVGIDAYMIPRAPQQSLTDFGDCFPALEHLIIYLSSGFIDIPLRILRILHQLREVSLIDVPLRHALKGVELLSVIVSGFYTKREIPPFETLYLPKTTLKELQISNSLKGDYPFSIKEAKSRHTLGRAFDID